MKPENSLTDDIENYYFNDIPLFNSRRTCFIEHIGGSAIIELQVYK